MRIIQIIDSLEIGGAERMAVNYANALADEIDFSGLVVSRKEGALQEQLNEKVDYLFLNKKASFDIWALWRLRKFVLKNQVAIIHAHSTSFFIAFLLKLICPSVKMIWHDHYGNSEFLDKRSVWLLRTILPFFAGVIVVNQKLKNWASNELHFSNSLYLPNFVSEQNYNNENKTTILHGTDGKRIVCLANLRFQKNHFLVLRLAEKLLKTNPDWTFHLVGKDFQDEYATTIKNQITDKGLSEQVYLYDSITAIAAVLEQSTIGILTSQSEGLPLALLEYGLFKKPVVVTNVGEVATVVTQDVNGLVIALDNEQLFLDSLVKLINDESLRVQLGNRLYQTINDKYTEKSVVEIYMNWIKRTIKNE